MFGFVLLAVTAASAANSVVSGVNENKALRRQESELEFQNAARRELSNAQRLDYQYQRSMKQAQLGAALSDIQANNAFRGVSGATSNSLQGDLISKFQEDDFIGQKFQAFAESRDAINEEITDLNRKSLRSARKTIPFKSLFNIGTSAANNYITYSTLNKPSGLLGL